MTFDEASEYMLQLNKRGIKPGLEGIRALCDALNNPQNDLSFIQIAGTNGKGSTAAFIAGILRAAGYKVGVYASPYVFEPLEIITVNGRNISKADYAKLTGQISECNDFGCTRFEVETVLAFLYFVKKNCDIVIMEAGMGGLLDATNVVDNTVASVITSIGMDHMQFLGNTIEEIATNKSGIIKNKSHVFFFEHDEAVDTIIEKAAICKSATIHKLSKKDIKKIKYKNELTSFSYKDLDNVEIGLLGTYQPENATLAIEVIKGLQEIFGNVSDKDIYKGLKNAHENGRFEKISSNPLFFLDGAHNFPAALRLKESIETYFTKKNIIYIMGMFKDKAAEDVVELMAPIASHVITVTLPNKERSLSAYELAKMVGKYNSMVSTADSIYEAVELSTLLADKNTVIIGFGSLSHLNDIKNAVRSINNNIAKRI